MNKRTRIASSITIMALAMGVIYLSHTLSQVKAERDIFDRKQARCEEKMLDMQPKEGK